MVKHKAKSNLICIALVVIIIINTVLPSVSYGENFFSLYPTDEYFETNEPLEINEENSNYIDAIYNSLISLQPPYDVLDNNVLTTEAQDGVMYDDGMIIIMHQKLSILLENHSEEERKAIINNGKNLLYNLQILLKDLTMKDFNIKNLPDSSRTFLNTITSDARYYYIMLLHFDSYGANLYWDLLKLRAEQDEDFSWINEDYDDPSERMFDNNREQFLADMVNSVDVVYNEYIQSYYNTNQSNQNQSSNENNGNSNYVPDDNVNGDITSEDADNNENESHNQFADGVEDNAQDSINNQPTGGFGLLANALDGVLGLITYPIKLVFIILPGLLGQAIMSQFKSGYGTEHSQGWLTIDNILFNQLTLTDINIFSQNAYLIFGENANIVEDGLTDGNALLPMRKAIANWYYAFRNLAIVLSLLMLIYIGIRIAFTNLAEKKAEYKNMLVNWFTGFGLIFILHYIIIIVININNACIQILARTHINPDNGEYQKLMNKLFEQSWYIDFTTSWTSAILYTLLVIITFIMLIMFIKRLITVSILVVVAPLIGITYSIDKSGDNKSQVVDTWLKEFVYNVFIQIAYAVSYLVFGRIAIDLACTDFSIGATVLAILSMLSMFMGVKIIKQIFGFDKASNLVQQLTMTAVMSKTISTATKGVKGTKGFVEKRANLKQEQRQKAELKNVPQYTPEGKSTEELVKQMKNQKTEEELKARMNEKEKNRKIPRRAHRNKPSIVSVPANILERGTRNIIGAVGDFAGKINDKINGKKEVVIPAQDIFTSMLHGYVNVSNERTGATMTREQFEKSTKKIMNEPLKNLNDEEKSLRLIMKDMNKKFGKEQAQSIVAHFKDEKWGNNGTNS